MEDQICTFSFKFDCIPGNCSENIDNSRIHAIIDASKLYKDDLHSRLQVQLEENSDLKIWYHTNCVSRYLSPKSLSKLKRQDTSLVEPSSKNLRQSYTQFEFRCHCLYCGENCDLQKCPKNPSRWRPAYLCHSTSRSDSRSYKDYILRICSERNDEWGNEVQVRMEGAISDLHAAEARYHVDCYSRFITRKFLPGQSMMTQTETSKLYDDIGLTYFVDLMESDRLQIWNSIQLFQEYENHGGEFLTRKWWFRG